MFKLKIEQLIKIFSNFSASSEVFENSQTFQNTNQPKILQIKVGENKEKVIIKETNQQKKEPSFTIDYFCMSLFFGLLFF